MANTAAALGNIQNMASTQQLRAQQCQQAIANEQLKQKVLESLARCDQEQQKMTLYSAIDSHYAATKPGLRCAGLGRPGKTRALSTVRDYIEGYGYEVRGLAATRRR